MVRILAPNMKSRTCRIEQLVPGYRENHCWELNQGLWGLNEGGKNQKLKICNTGTLNKLTNETIFNRFTKENSQSYGLGLAIVKQICNTHNMTIQYLKSDFHCFVLSKLPGL